MSSLTTKPTTFRHARRKEVGGGARRRNSDDWEPVWASYWLAALVGIGYLGCIDLARRGMAAGDHGLPTVLAGLPLRARKGG